MSRRDFRLRSVLGARKRELDVARGQLADELREKAREVREELRHLARIRETAQQLQTRLAIGMSAAPLRAADQAMSAAQCDARLAGQRAQARDAAILVARTELTQARKRLRSLEILEERWREEQRRMKAKADQKRIDEIATVMRGGRFS